MTRSSRTAGTSSANAGWSVRRRWGSCRRTSRLPPRNDGVKAWADHSPEEQRVFTRLQSAFAGMLDHADRHLARLVAFLEEAGVKDDTLILVLSDNGQPRGRPAGLRQRHGPSI